MTTIELFPSQNFTASFRALALDFQAHLLPLYASMVPWDYDYEGNGGF